MILQYKYISAVLDTHLLQITWKRKGIKMWSMFTFGENKLDLHVVQEA